MKHWLWISFILSTHAQRQIPQPTGFPPLDQPPTPNPEFTQLVSQIPNIQPKSYRTGVGAVCDSNLQKMKDNCDWTCGAQCTRPADIVHCSSSSSWALTYDDGPSQFTLPLLDYLNSINAKATFCVVGSRVVEYPDIVKRIFDEGHQLCVHTWSHQPLTTQSSEVVIAELEYTARAIQTVTGQRPIYMRPPYGDMDDRIRYIAASLQMLPMLWNRDTADWQYIAIPVGNLTSNSNSTNSTTRTTSTTTTPALPTPRTTPPVPINAGTTNRTFALPEEFFSAWVSDRSIGHISLQHDLYEKSAGWAIPAARVLMRTRNSSNPLTIMSASECVGNLYPYVNRNVRIPKSMTSERLNLQAESGPALDIVPAKIIQGKGQSSNDAGRENGWVGLLVTLFLVLLT